jgi:hypothetical protein
LNFDAVATTLSLCALSFDGMRVAKNLLITRHSKNSGENCAKFSGPSFHGKLALDGSVVQLN